jgi:3',5'-cyclic AMP phosphodiesterase CpdA
VQVSDLHIGDVDPQGSGNAAIEPLLAKTIGLLPFLEGLVGHQAQSLRDLVSFFRSLPNEKGVPRHMLVSGDFTRCGRDSEMTLAAEYFHGQIDVGIPPSSLPTGMSMRRYPKSIPGNHDHWGGQNFPISGAATIYPHAKFANPMPGREDFQLPDGWTLVLARVNSDADVSKWGPDRAFARGDFESELTSLASEFKAPRGPKEVRALAIHHSFSHGGRTLNMKSNSRKALVKFLDTHKIKVVLSGHTHICDDYEIRDDSGRLIAHELCCGSTTQLDTLPAAWAKLLPNHGTLQGPPNSLLVHQLVTKADGRPEWQAHPWYRHPIRGFEHVGFHFPVPAV